MHLRQWATAAAILVALTSATGCRRIAKRLLRPSSASAASSETTAGASAWSEASAKSLSTLPGALSPPRRHPRLLLPALLDGARTRANPKEKRDEWPRLRDWCDARDGGRTEPPEGTDYPGVPNIGEGYQGDDYFHAIANLGLCYQIALTLDPKHANSYAARGIDVLLKMSEPSGPHAQDPLRDSGYGIRFFGTGMALGFDWFYDALKPDERKRIVAALNRWVRAFDEKGFANSHPQGNYFAGYYAAKAYIALATEGDNPEAEAQWKDWIDRLHAKMVQPYYAKYLADGGWPEGWNYGPLATLNMSLPILAAETAKGVDLLKAPGAPYAFPLDQARQLLHYTWPSRKTLDDRGDQAPSENPSHAPSYLYMVVAGLLEHWRDPLAPAFHRYAREVIAADHGEVQPWLAMLFWDARAAEADYHGQPLSFHSTGMQTIAMRATWETDAVWADFASGPYVNNHDSGEMFFDEGALTVVRGAKPLLVNASAALYRHRPGTNDGENMFDLIYADNFGSNSSDHSLRNRTLFNIFYVKGSRFGQESPDPEDTRTTLKNVEDRSGVVVARGEHLEDMYFGHKGKNRLVDEWTRQLIYVRPGLFLLDDRTKKGDSGTDQWLAFHLPSKDTSALHALLPRGAKTAVIDVFNKHKVYRVEVRPPDNNSKQRWLTVFDAMSGTPAALTRATAVTEPFMNGALLETATENRLIASFEGGQGAYEVPARATSHVLYDLPPGVAYAPSATVSGGKVRVSVTRGAGPAVSPSGALIFKTTAAGAVEAVK